MIVDVAGAFSLGFVGADGSLHPAAADGDAALDFARRHGQCQQRDLVGIIVIMTGLMGPEIDDLEPGHLELGEQLFLQFKSTMISCKPYTHWKILVLPLLEDRAGRVAQMGLSLHAEANSPSLMYFGVHQMKA